MRLRGFTGARDGFHRAAIVQNLKTLANHLWRPPNTPRRMPRVSVSCVELGRGRLVFPLQADPEEARTGTEIRGRGEFAAGRKQPLAACSRG